MRQGTRNPAVGSSYRCLAGDGAADDDGDQCGQAELQRRAVHAVQSEAKPSPAWHQDEQFIPTRDRSLTAAWIALDDATVGNGCLSAVPGSHRPGVLYPLREQHDERFDCSQEAYRLPYRDEQAVTLELKAGDVVLFNGYLLHHSPEHRRARAASRSCTIT